MARKKKVPGLRGRRPSLKVAARKAEKLRQNVKGVLTDLEDLERRLLRLETLIEASRKAEKLRKKKKTGARRGIRGKGPNVRDIAFEFLAGRKKPLGIQEIAKGVLRKKPGKAGDNFTQNLGAALARDSRFRRVGRGTYAIRGKRR